MSPFTWINRARWSAINLPALVSATLTLIGSGVYVAAPQIATKSGLWPDLGQGTYIHNSLFLFGALLVIVGILGGDSRADAAGALLLAIAFAILVVLTAESKGTDAWTAEWTWAVLAAMWTTRFVNLLQWSRHL